MPHPLVDQLRFTRQEFLRSVRGVDPADAVKRILPMNSLSWNVGHLAWQEQRYFISFPTGQSVRPELVERFAFGAPASTPPLTEVVKAWREITRHADPFLDQLTAADLAGPVASRGRALKRTYGNLLQRVIYHYWYHTGENMAIRQQLDPGRLPQFVGNIDDQAPFRIG